MSEVLSENNQRDVPLSLRYDPGAIALLHEELMGDYFGNIAQTIFSTPISAVTVYASRESKEQQVRAGHEPEDFLDLQALVDFDDSIDVERSVGDIEYLRNQVFLQVARDFGFEEQGNGFIFVDDSGAQVVMSIQNSCNGNRNGIVLHTNEAHVKDRKCQVLLQPVELSEDSLTRQLELFNKIMAAIITTAYDLSGREAPYRELAVDPRTTLERNWRKSEETARQIEKAKRTISLDDVGGHDEVISYIRQMVSAVNHPELHDEWGGSKPKGVLLYGPPGTGKTLVAEGVAAEVDGNFGYINISDISNMYFGESERKVAELFDKAAIDKKPTILFFDEVDAIAANRATSNSEAGDRIVATLLAKLDGIGATNNIFVIGATNKKEKIDDAMLRPGRFDRLLKMDLPDLSGRISVFESIMRRFTRKANMPIFSEDIDVTRLAAASAGMSGAHIEGVIQRVIGSKVDSGLRPQDGILISQEEILAQIQQFEGINKVLDKDVGTGFYL